MNVIKKAIQKYRSFPVPVKASFFFVFCGIFKDIVDVISTPIFTRMLSKDEYGLFSVYNSWYQIVRIIITLSIFSDSFNVGMSRYGEKKERFASSQQGLVTTLFLIWSSVIFVFRDAISNVTGFKTHFIILMLAQVIFTSSFYIWFQKKRYVYGYRILTAVTLTYTVLQPLLGIVLIKINNGGGYGFSNGDVRIYAGVGVQILFGAAFFVIQFIKNKTYFDKEYWSFSLKMNVPLLPHYLSQIVLNQSDKLMIDFFRGKSFTAIYAVAHSAAFVLQAITNNLNATFIPWLYEKLKKREYSGIRRVVTSLLLLCAAVVFALVLIAPEAMKILAGDGYLEGMWIIPPLAVSVYLIFFYMLFSDLELFCGKSHYVAVSSIVGAASNIILNYIFIQKYGYLAAGFTTAVGYALMCLCHVLFTRLACKKENVPFDTIYNTKIIALITGVLFVLCGAAMLLYNFTVLRYALLLALIAVLTVMRKTLIKIIKDLRGKKNDQKNAE